MVDAGRMPRRDVVLTGLIAFGAGVAVGANWKKLRKEIGPVLEKLGMKMADLGEFLSAAGMEEFVPKPKETKSRRARARSKARPSPMKHESFGKKVPRNGTPPQITVVPPSSRNKASPRKPLAGDEAEAPRATGTLGA